MIVVLPCKFAQEISCTSRVFVVCIVFRPCEDNNIDLWEDEDTYIIDLSNVPKQLHQKFYDFFNTCNANQLAPYQATNYPINLKPSTKLLYMCIYNIFLAKLKALDDYIKEALAKG